MRYCFITLLILSIFISCTTNTENARTVTEEVTGMLGNYNNDVNSKGLLAEFNYLDSSKDFFWIPPGFDVPLNYDTIASMIRKTSENIISVNNRIDQLEVREVSPRVAVYTCKLYSVIKRLATYPFLTRLLRWGSLLNEERTGNCLAV